jgi:predicted nucleic acid-binding protein
MRTMTVVLAIAVPAGAVVIVTGDQHLLVLDRYQGIESFHLATS